MDVVPSRAGIDTCHRLLSDESVKGIRLNWSCYAESLRLRVAPAPAGREMKDRADGHEQRESSPACHSRGGASLD